MFRGPRVDSLGYTQAARTGSPGEEPRVGPATPYRERPSVENGQMATRTQREVGWGARAGRRLVGDHVVTLQPANRRGG